MKKYLVWLVAAIFGIAAIVCAVLLISGVRPSAFGDVLKEIEMGNTPYYSEGKFLKANGSNIIILNDNSPCVMSNQTGAENVFDDYSDGDVIKVLHSTIAESYPEQMRIYAVKLVSRGTYDDLPEEVMDSLRELGWTADRK